MIQESVSYLTLSPYLVPYIWESPDIVYHYTDLNAMKSIIENNTFWATNHKFLNDTEEKKYIKTVLSVLKEKGVFSELSKVYDTVISYVYGIQQSFNAAQDENLQNASDAYIISFSMNGDSLTLWSEYAKKSGINIGIDCKKLRKDIVYDEPGEFKNVFGGKVIYIDSQNDQDSNLLKIVNMIKEIIDDCNIYGVSNENRDRIINSHLTYLSNFIKHCSMSAEEEYRLVCFPHDKESKTKIRVKDELLIPYIEYKDEINSAITSITVSPVNKNHLTLEGIQYLLDKYKIPSYISVDNNNAPKENEVKINQSQITLRY